MVGFIRYKDVVLGHMLIFWEYSSSSREKKVEYLLVYRIVNYRGFVLFRAFLRYIVGHFCSIACSYVTSAS